MKANITNKVWSSIWDKKRMQHLYRDVRNQEVNKDPLGTIRTLGKLHGCLISRLQHFATDYKHSCVKDIPSNESSFEKIHSQKVVIRNKIMFNKIHDKNQQDDPSGNGTCHQASQPESNLLNSHGSRKRKQTPVWDLSSDLHKHWHTHSSAHTQTHMHKHMCTHTHAQRCGQM